MDRRSWLWRRKSSEKSPGETESSGSISSHSERFSDDQACATTHSSQSQEISCKSAAGDEEITPNVKSLTEKLSNALLNISAKEELVKQHAKVAEEAVSGWEKAEKEVLSLKQQLEVAAANNSLLEDQVGHLDSALKECVRQLRHARENQDQKIQEAVSKERQDFETRKSELETQILELQSELELVKTEPNGSNFDDLERKFEALEKENSQLKVELLLWAEKLEIRTIERDLSTRAAETASKQHLESIKKLTKVEAECRRVKAMARKSPYSHNLNSHALSSYSAESFPDSQSDSGERSTVVENDMRKANSLELNECEPSPSRKAMGKTLMVPLMEINLMDDFLEMEKLASLQDAGIGNRLLETGNSSDQPNASENQLRQEIEILIRRIAELEEKVEIAEVKNVQLEMALTGSKKQVQALQNQLKDTEVKLSELKILEVEKVELETALAESRKQLERSQSQLNEAEGKLTELEKIKSEKLELAIRLTGSEKQVEAFQNQLRDTEVELSELKTSEARKLELETALVESRNQLENLQSQLNKAHGKLTELEKIKSEKLELAICLTETKKQLEDSANQLTDAEGKLADLKTLLELSNDAQRMAKDEVKHANGKREIAESRLKDVEAEAQSLLSKFASLEEDAERERALSAKHSAKCEELQAEISEFKDDIKRQHKAEIQNMSTFEGDWKMKQENELAAAASKFAECQRTIASLGQQLKSLATFEDFLLESEDPLSINSLNDPGELNFFENYSESLNKLANSGSLRKGDDAELSFPLTPVISSERNLNGLGKILNQNKSGRSI